MNNDRFTGTGAHFLGESGQRSEHALDSALAKSISDYIDANLTGAAAFRHVRAAYAPSVARHEARPERKKKGLFSHLREHRKTDKPAAGIKTEPVAFPQAKPEAPSPFEAPNDEAALPTAVFSASMAAEAEEEDIVPSEEHAEEEAFPEAGVENIMFSTIIEDEEPADEYPEEEYDTAIFSPIIHEEDVFPSHGAMLSLDEEERERKDYKYSIPAPAPHMAMPYPAVPSEDTDWLGKLAKSFGETLLDLIEEKRMKNSEFYNRANISKQLFHRITTQTDRPPKKNIALACAVALRLDLEETKSLLEKAGYALSPADVTDVIVEAFISAKHYDIFDINEYLYKYERGLLGSSMN